MRRQTKSEFYFGVTPDDDADIKVTLPEETSKSFNIWSEVKSLGRDILFAGLTAILIVVFVVQPVKVEGTSMLPRLQDNERIFVNKFIYQLDTIKRGDIVVFWYPKDPSKSFIKRVIGLPGETIRMDRTGQLFINGQPQDEPYLSPDHNRMPAMIPDTHIESHFYFVMGDNRDASNDSRSWGLVPEKYIYGKAMFCYWPLTKIGSIGD